MDITVGIDTYLEDFQNYLQHIVRPKWQEKELGVKLFDSDITNTLVALNLKDKGLVESR